MERTLKDVAIELLDLYKDAEEARIWEYSGKICEDLMQLEKDCEDFKREIERLADDETE